MTKTINQLNELNESPADDDELLVRDTSAMEDKRVSYSNVMGGLQDDISQRTIYVGSVSELRASSGLYGDVYVQGYNGPSTLGGGHVYLDESDTTSPDNGVTVFVDTDGQRWKAKEGFVCPEPFTVTVGSSGDFSELNSALQWLAAMNPVLSDPSSVSSDSSTHAIVNILSGTAITETVWLKGIDLGWVRIDSEDSEVPAIMTGSGNVFDVSHCVTPVLNCLINMDGSDDTGTASGILARHGSYVRVLENCGIINAPFRGLHLSSSEARISFTNWSGAGYSSTSAIPRACIRPGNNSSIFGTSVNMSNSSGRAFAGGDCANVVLRDSNFTGAAEAAAEVGAGVFDFHGSDFSNSGGVGLEANSSAIAVAYDCTWDNCGDTAIVANFGAKVIARSRFEPVSISNCQSSVAAVIAQDSSEISLTGVSVTGSLGDGVLFIGGSRGDVKSATITGSARDNINCRASSLDASGVTATGAGRYGAVATEGSTLSLQGADVSGVSSDIRCRSGSTINANGSTGTVDPSGSVNAITFNGIVFQD